MLGTVERFDGVTDRKALIEIGKPGAVITEGEVELRGTSESQV